MRIRRVDAAAVRPLRLEVLRPGGDPASVVFAGDDTGVHFAAYDGDALVGCVSLLCEPLDGRPGWRLRGMAVEPGAQGRGVGARLLAAVHELAGDRLLWCNARVTAAGFYARAGWRAVGERFVTADTGVPHVRMLRGAEAAPVHGSTGASGRRV